MHGHLAVVPTTPKPRLAAGDHTQIAVELGGFASRPSFQPGIAHYRPKEVDDESHARNAVWRAALGAEI
jgi:hypothetical protein